MTATRTFFLPHRFVFGVFELDPDGQLWQGTNCTQLPPKELALLRLLLRAGGALVPKNDLLSQIWLGADMNEESLTRCIYSLRKALGPYKYYIATVYGRGYRMRCDIQSKLEAPRTVQPHAAVDSKAGNYHPEFLDRLVAHYQTALGRDHSNPYTWCGLAEALIGQAMLGLGMPGQLHEKVDHALAKALALKPDYAPALARLAWVATGQGAGSTAQALLRMAEWLPDGCPGDLAMYRAYCHWCRGDAAEAAALLDKSLEVSAQSVPTWLLRCRVAFTLAPATAPAWARRAREVLGGSQPVMRCWYAMVLAWEGNIRQARQLLRPTVEPLRGDLGLWHAYVIARGDRVAGRQALAAWRMQHAGWPISAEELAVVRAVEGEAAAAKAWPVLLRHAQPWQQGALGDPRIADLAPQHSSRLA